MFSMYSNLGLQQSLYSFEVSCTHKSKGCEWTGELRKLDDHLNADPPADKTLRGCPFTMIKCPLGCVECRGGIFRKDINSHVKDAQLKLFEEKLQKFQNMTEQFKMQLEEMKRDFVQRTTKLEAAVDALSMVTEKPQPSGQLPHITGTFKPTGAEFTMTSFEEYRRDSDRWYSPHFYTHPNGYKMCLGVDANGSLLYRGTHLSVFVFLMKGEFDDQLKWPFCGEVVVKLVSQEGDSYWDHIVRTVRFSKSTHERYCKRVMTGERSVYEWGCHQFLPLAELQPKYLKNNCIKLCIKKVEHF